jgi:hypothetical protein
VVLEFFVLLYAIEKVGSKLFSTIRAKKKAHNWLRVAFYVFPVVMTWLNEEYEN